MQVNLDDAVNKGLELVGSLTYLSYCNQRKLSPHIPYKQWGLIPEFGDNVEQFETLYQKEEKSK